MHVQVKGLTKAMQIRRFAARKLEAALAQFSHLIQEADVRLTDVNGPERGGVDKLCRVVLHFKDNSNLVIEELGSEVFHVIDRVVDRLHHSISRQISREARTDRQDIHQSKLLAASI